MGRRKGAGARSGVGGGAGAEEVGGVGEGGGVDEAADEVDAHGFVALEEAAFEVDGAAGGEADDEGAGAAFGAVDGEGVAAGVEGEGDGGAVVDGGEEGGAEGVVGLVEESPGVGSAEAIPQEGVAGGSMEAEGGHGLMHGCTPLTFLGQLSHNVARRSSNASQFRTFRDRMRLTASGTAALDRALPAGEAKPGGASGTIKSAIQLAITLSIIVATVLDN